MNRSKEPHAVVVPYPAQGHINPVMQLAKQLAIQQGYRVTFVNTTHNHFRIQESQPCSGGDTDMASSSPHPNIHLAHIPDGFPPHYNRMADLSVLSQAIDDHMPGPFRTLVAELMASAHPPCCIISDTLMLFTQDVAHSFGLPRIAIWLQSAASFAINLHIPQLIQEGVLPLKVEGPKMITSIPGHPPLASQDLPSFFLVNDMSSYMFQFKLRPFCRLGEAKAILINTFLALEKEVLEVLQEEYRVVPAGPFLPPALMGMRESMDKRTGTGLWPEDNDCLPWLDKQEDSSVLYISFGSIASLSAEQFKELVLGLEASQKPILWAIRPDLLDLISPSLPPSFLKGNEGHVYITSWAPQALVLSHQSVGGFLTHCGWNSTLESISMGVPTLCWPYFADQMLNRKWMVDEWKVGKQFEPSVDGLITRGEVENKVRLLFDTQEGREMRERARELSNAAKRGVLEMGSSYAGLHEVLKCVSCLDGGSLSS